MKESLQLRLKFLLSEPGNGNDRNENRPPLLLMLIIRIFPCSLVAQTHTHPQGEILVHVDSFTEEEGILINTYSRVFPLAHHYPNNFCSLGDRALKKFLLSSSNFKIMYAVDPGGGKANTHRFSFSLGESVHTFTFLGLLQVFSCWTLNTNRRTACSSKSIRLPLTVMIPLPLFSLSLSLPQLSSNQHT